jgi:hypothetical protein
MAGGSGKKLGRPKTPFKQEYCKMLVDHMAQGYHYLSFAGTIGVTFDILYDWEAEHKTFVDAKKEGIALGMAYDEKILKAGTLGLKFLDTPTGRMEININPALLIFKLKNRYPEHYKEKHEITATSKYEKSSDDQLAELGKMALEFIKKAKEDDSDSL